MKGKMTGKKKYVKNDYTQKNMAAVFRGEVVVGVQWVCACS